MPKALRAEIYHVASIWQVWIDYADFSWDGCRRGLPRAWCRQNCGLRPAPSRVFPQRDGRESPGHGKPLLDFHKVSLRQGPSLLRTFERSTVASTPRTAEGSTLVSCRATEGDVNQNHIASAITRHRPRPLRYPRPLSRLERWLPAIRQLTRLLRSVLEPPDPAARRPEPATGRRFGSWPQLENAKPRGSSPKHEPRRERMFGGSSGRFIAARRQPHLCSSLPSRR